MADIVLTDEYVDRLKARAVPGAFYERDTKAWIMRDPTPRAAAVALKLFPALISSNPELLILRERLAQDVRPIDLATDWVKSLEQQIGQTPIPGGRVHDELLKRGKDYYDFQRVDLLYLSEVLAEHGGAYLGWERGLGKTLGAAVLIDDLGATRSLIICPNTAKQAVWAAELDQWCPWLELVVIRNTKAHRERDLRDVELLTKEKRPFAFVVHYEAVLVIAKQRSARNGWKQYGEWDIVVSDEAHRMSNPDAQMVRQIKRIPTAMRLAMSGSVIQNHAEELFSQLQWLFPDRYSSKWRDWNDRYLDYVDSGYANVCVGVRIEKLAELRDELGRFMVYRRKEDELDLPPKVEETRMIELSPRQREVYDELSESFFANLGEHEVIKASDGLVLLTRLRQIATGLDLVSNELVDSSKQDLAVEMIQDNPDESFVVFSWYRNAATALSDRLTKLGISNLVVTGDTKLRDRTKYIEQFQRGEGQVFIGTISTLGESITLHRANNAIFLDRSWNPAANDQAADRIYRIGQTKPVTITHIVAKDTVDEERVLPVLMDKQALRRMILGG